MSLVPAFFSKKKKSESLILIDINADGVTGAYVRFTLGAAPAILYTRALPFEARADEPHERAMLRALDLLGKALISEGAPVLSRATGSASIDLILVAINAPWQETTVHTEHFEEKTDFLFTKGMVTKKLESRRGDGAEKKLLIDENVIGTTLNGYETKNPYGKYAHRADITVLTSLIERETAHGILATIESLFHTKKILPIAGDSLRYQAVEELFPHDTDGILLDATSQTISAIALLRKGIFSIMTSVETPSGENAWLESVTAKLTEIAKEYPLPRTIFLLSREALLNELQKKLCAAQSMGLWLSDNPPKIVPVTQSLLKQNIEHISTNNPDIILLLMALYFQKKRFAPEESNVHTNLG